MTTIKLKDDQITGALNRIAASLTNMTPMMQDIGELLTRSTKERFKTGTAPDGSAWAARSPATLAHYKKLGLTPAVGKQAGLF